MATPEALNSAIGTTAGTKYIRLTADIALSAYLRIGQNSVSQTVTIDMNGRTLQRTGLTKADANGHVIEGFGAGNLTLTSSKTGGQLTGGWANNGGTTCTICGVSASTSTVSIYLPDKVDGTFIDGHYATNPLTVQVVTNTTFELPAPPADHLPGGVTFAGWQVGTPTELNINSYWVGNGELLYHPGANYAITGDVSLTARYAGIKLSLADDDENAMTLGLNNGKQTESIR